VLAKVNSKLKGMSFEGAVALVTGATRGIEDGLAAMMRNTPARRVASPDEIAETIAYLASDRASFIHGAIVPIDGGRTAVQGRHRSAGSTVQLDADWLRGWARR
jgi:NAD(P)-dependent dehydrogenase (short-subunit alcohol dehydrogenase family)